MQQLARYSIAAIGFDNLDKKMYKTVQHLTLPVLFFRNVLAVATGDTTDSLTLNEVVDQMNIDFVLLNSSKNVKEKEAFMKIVYSELAEICSTIPYFEWAASTFPRAHAHKFRTTSSLRTRGV